MSLISDEYNMIKYLYNINDLENIRSIFQNGILSKNELRRRNIYSKDISNLKVQEIRNDKYIPNHKALHDYANLYFNPRNPMMYYLINNYNLNDLCIICVDKKVLDLKDTVISDRNAASELAAFDDPRKAKRYLDFKRIFAKYWTDQNPVKQYENKQILCAEVLVIDKVPVQYLKGVIVCTKEAKNKIESMNIKIKVVINKELFFK